MDIMRNALSGFAKVETKGLILKQEAAELHVAKCKKL